MMQNSWRVIDCTQFEGSLGYERGRMMVHAKDSDDITQVPLSQTAVVLLGLKARCSTALLFEFAQQGVSVMLCDWRGVPVGAMESWSDVPTVVASRHRSQVSMSVPRRKNAWMRIVKAKILGQAHALSLLGRDGGPLLEAFSVSVRSGDASNVEGHAAREYWQRLFSAEEKFHRVPGDGSGRNAQLDYAYTILRGFVIKAVCAAGLDPTFGVNHHNRSNYFCLADDLIEPFRAAIDVKVAELDADAPVSEPEVKRFLVESVNGQFGQGGLTIPSAINDFAQQFGLYCEKKTEVLNPPIFGEPYET